MRSQISKTYFTIPVLYIGVILSLLFLQFSDRETFSDTASGMSLRGSFQAGSSDKGKGIASLQLSSDFADLSFSSDKKLTLIQNDGTLKTAAVRGYKKTQTGVELIFDGDVRLLADKEGTDGTTITGPAA